MGFDTSDKNIRSTQPTVGVSVATRRAVLIAGAAPEECVRRAQLAILTEGAWHLVGPAPFRAHGDLSFAPLPEVCCPVVDLRGVPPENDERVADVMGACVADHAGVINMDGLLTGLEALGGKVVPSSEFQVPG